MAVISIIGTSGVGKSFLVKQLAAATCSPAFFEGEEGTIPKSIFENIIKGGNPIARWKFFINRHKGVLENAISISKKGFDCFVDGSTLSGRAIIIYEEEKYKEKIRKIIRSIAYLKSDVNVLLIANKEKLRTQINIRSRYSEKNKKALERALKIQEAFVYLAKKEPNTIIINRTNLDFSNPAHIQKILKKIKSI